MRINQRLQSSAWMQILNTTFHRRTGRLIHRDLSTTDNVWNIMATAVYADTESQSLQALKHHLRKAWKLTSLSTLQNLFGLMPNKLIAVTKNKENTIPY